MAFWVFFDSYTGLLGRLVEPFLTCGLVLFNRGPGVELSNSAEGGRLAGQASQTA